jgi:hypothetical protein
MRKQAFGERPLQIEAESLNGEQVYNEVMLRLNFLFLDYTSECFVAVSAFVQGYC